MADFDNQSQFGMTWWADPKKAHEPVTALIKALAGQNNGRSQQNLRMARLYGNMDILGLAPDQYFRTSQPITLTNRVTLNVIKSCTDTVSSRIAKHKPRPTFLTNDGDWELQQKAKKLNRFMQGVFYETNYYSIAADVFRDACIFGTGIIKHYIKNGRVHFERVIPEEVIVDSAEAVYGCPQSLFQKKQVNRSVLLAKFSKDQAKVAAIKAAPNSAKPTNDSMIADMVEVVESWHLRSGPGADDGVHTITIPNCTLFEEKYEDDEFPFLFYKWTLPIVGFYGTGLAEELIGLQLEINKLLRQIQLSQHLLSTPKVFLENNSKVVSAQMNNEIGAIIKYTGTKPDIHSFQTVHPEIYQHLERLYAKAYEISGVSQLAANAKKPAGLDSGVALREFQDIESERFALAQQRYEDMAIRAALAVVRRSKEIVKKGSSYKVKSPNKKVIDEIDFKDINLEEATYVLQCFPTNFLPATPAGRLQSVQELMQAGLIDREVGLSLLDFPDLEGAMSLANASYDYTMMSIEQILYEGEYSAPEPTGNLKFMMGMAQMSYLKAKVNKVPEARLEMLDRWLQECVRMQSAALQAAQPAPMAAPEAQPTSELLPNVPGAPQV